MVYPPLNTGKNHFFKKLAETYDQQDDYHLIAITHGAHSGKFLSTINVSWHQVYDIADYIKECTDYSMDLFKALVQKYHLTRVNETFEHAVEIFSRGYPGSGFTEDQQNRSLYALLKFFEQVLSQHNNAILVDEGVAGLYTPLYQLFPHFNSAVFSLIASRITNKFAITHQGYETFDKVTEKYQADSYTQKELTEARAYIDNFLKEKTKPDWYGRYQPKGRIATVFAKLFSQKVTGLLVDIFDSLRFPKNIFTPEFGGWVHNNLKNFYKPMLHQALVKWDGLVEGEEYFLYPLHVQPEASINVLGAYYTDQLNLIRQISLALPLGTLLYVKEHSAFIGKRESLKFYQSLKKVKNVRLIDPFQDPHPLVEKATAVLTISGTMGYEAILFKKPVILFGDPFYKIYKNCLIVENMKDLYHLLHKSRDFGRDIRDDDVDRFIAATFYGLYRGNLFFEDENSLNEQNIADIRTAINSEIKSLAQRG